MHRRARGDRGWRERRGKNAKGNSCSIYLRAGSGGGTEIYVEALAHELGSCGVESLIVAPSSSDLDESYNHQGLRVRRYSRGASEPVHASRDLRFG